MEEVIGLRHELHRCPELSGSETETAARIVRFFSPLCPDALLTGLGGVGVAAVFAGGGPGPTLLLRAELDALAIQELNHLPYRSARPNISHKCGHDGHMAILVAVGRQLAGKRPARGRVVLLFQPAEETGAGAAAVIQDPQFPAIAPDFVFALHNLPGFPLGSVVVRDGPFTAASRGAIIGLVGATAHAAQPETGRSPALAMAQIVESLSCLPADIAPSSEGAFATVVGAQLGNKAFGTAPGEAEIWATLRSETDSAMERIVAYNERLVADAAARFNLDWSLAYSDIFSATLNSPAANEVVRRSRGDNGVIELESPFRWSEDFGRFTAIAEGALFGIGAGEEMPELHNGDYDFPDALISPAAEIFRRIIGHYLDK